MVYEINKLLIKLTYKSNFSFFFNNVKLYLKFTKITNITKLFGYNLIKKTLNSLNDVISFICKGLVYIHH